ncbi:hypothetical protein BDV3_000213 [Batrachochytrium dendrobatidis]
MVAVAYFIWTNTAIEILDQAVDGLSYMIDISLLLALISSSITSSLSHPLVSDLYLSNSYLLQPSAHSNPLRISSALTCLLSRPSIISSSSTIPTTLPIQSLCSASSPPKNLPPPFTSAGLVVTSKKDAASTGLPLTGTVHTQPNADLLAQLFSSHTSSLSSDIYLNSLNTGPIGLNPASQLPCLSGSAPPLPISTGFSSACESSSHGMVSADCTDLSVDNLSSSTLLMQLSPANPNLDDAWQSSVSASLQQPSLNHFALSSNSVLPSPALTLHPHSASPLLFLNAQSAFGLQSNLAPRAAESLSAFTPSNADYESAMIQQSPYLDSASTASLFSVHNPLSVIDTSNPLVSGTALDWMSPVSMSRDGSSLFSHPALIKSSPSTPQVGFPDALRAFSFAYPSNDAYSSGAAALSKPFGGEPGSFGTAAVIAAATSKPRLFAKLAPAEPLLALQAALRSDQPPITPKVSSSISANPRKRKERTMDRDELVAEIEDKRRRNTESARRSRERKATRLEELESLTLVQQARIAELEAMVQSLKADNERLKISN